VTITVTCYSWAPFGGAYLFTCGAIFWPPHCSCCSTDSVYFKHKIPKFFSFFIFISFQKLICFHFSIIFNRCTITSLGKMWTFCCSYWCSLPINKKNVTCITWSEAITKKEPLSQLLKNSHNSVFHCKKLFFPGRNTFRQFT